MAESNPDLTVEDVDRALAAAQECGDVPEDEIALLWVKRARLIGVEFRPGHLTLTMGVSQERAEELLVILVERTLVEYEPEQSDSEFLSMLMRLVDRGYAEVRVREDGQPEFRLTETGSEHTDELIAADPKLREFYEEVLRRLGGGE